MCSLPGGLPCCCGHPFPALVPLPGVGKWSAVAGPADNPPSHPLLQAGAPHPATARLLDLLLGPSSGGRRVLHLQMAALMYLLAAEPAVAGEVQRQPLRAHGCRSAGSSGLEAGEEGTAVRSGSVPGGSDMAGTATEGGNEAGGSGAGGPFRSAGLQGAALRVAPRQHLLASRILLALRCMQRRRRLRHRVLDAVMCCLRKHLRRRAVQPSSSGPGDSDLHLPCQVGCSAREGRSSCTEGAPAVAASVATVSASFQCSQYLPCSLYRIPHPFPIAMSILFFNLVHAMFVFFLKLSVAPQAHLSLHP